LILIYASRVGSAGYARTWYVLSTWGYRSLRIASGHHGLPYGSPGLPYGSPDSGSSNCIGSGVGLVPTRNRERITCRKESDHWCDPPYDRRRRNCGWGGNPSNRDIGGVRVFNAGMRGAKGTRIKAERVRSRSSAGPPRGSRAIVISSLRRSPLPYARRHAGANIPADVQLDGRSLVPILRDPKASWGHRIVSMANYQISLNKWTCEVSLANYKFALSTITKRPLEQLLTCGLPTLKGPRKNLPTTVFRPTF